MNCGSKMIKYLLFLFNLVFVLCGVVLICFGVAIKSYFKEYEIILDDRFLSAPSLLISSGSIIFFIAFFGCCGALKENHCMVLTFSCLLGAIFVMELVAGITGYILSEDTGAVLARTMKNSMKFYKEGKKDTQKLWDTMQASLHCCGADNYTDWFEVYNQSVYLPMSCCTSEYGVIGSSNCTDSMNFFTTPCMPGLSTSIGDYAWSLGALATTIAFMQTVGIVFACYLARSIRSSSYESV